MSGAIVVMAKAPIAGRVKTRLCPPFTHAQAARLAQAALRDTLDAVAATTADRLVVALAGPRGPWLSPGFDVLFQRGAGLAARLAAAFHDIRGPALAIGMDTPQVTPELLRGGLDALRDHDAALGRSPDGGYWAIGLREPDPAAFIGVPMSSPRTATAQHARLRELGLAVAPLPPLRDVDTIESARLVAAECPGTRFAAAMDQTRAERHVT